MKEFITVGRVDIPRKEFKICRKEGENYLCQYHGQLGDLTDSWIASGLIKEIIEVTDEDVFFVANVYDYPGVGGPPEEEEELDYDVSG